jgi:hypothetical protein
VPVVSFQTIFLDKEVKIIIITKISFIFFLTTVIDPPSTTEFSGYHVLFDDSKDAATAIRLASNQLLYHKMQLLTQVVDHHSDWD